MPTNIQTHLSAFCARYRAETEAICAKLGELAAKAQTAADSGDPEKLREALQGACDYEFDATGDCELFGGIAEEMGAQG